MSGPSIGKIGHETGRITGIGNISGQMGKFEKILAGTATQIKPETKQIKPETKTSNTGVVNGRDAYAGTGIQRTGGDGGNPITKTSNSGVANGSHDIDA